MSKEKYVLSSQSKDLSKFYWEYWNWLSAHAIKGTPFFHDVGLCGAIWDCPDIDSQMAGREMKDQFHAAGFASVHGVFVPFNRTLALFQNEGCDRRCHINPKRRAWVMQHLVTSNNKEKPSDG